MKPAFFRLLFAGIASLLVGGCVRSEQPLSAVKDARPDARLAGTWHEEKTPEHKSDFRLSFDANGQGRINGKAEDGSWKPPAEDMNFFVTRTEKATYVNALVPDDDKHPPGSAHYQFFKYTVSDDQKTLRVWMTRLATFQKAVRESKLKGQIEEGSATSKPEENSVLLQDSSETILRFIERLPPEEAFVELGVYGKVN